MVECFGFENRRTFTGTEGSNPSLSDKIDVKLFKKRVTEEFFINQHKNTFVELKHPFMNKS